MARLGSESKAGYFATPMEELSLLCSKLKCEVDQEHERIRILDPCCGEGTALRLLHSRFREIDVWTETYGVELEKSRYEAASQTEIDVVIHDGYENLRTEPKFSLLWLNPPYQDGFGERAELTFLRRLTSAKYGVLQKDGILMFCIPQYVLKDTASILSGRFRNFRVYRFTDGNYDVFKQIVVIATLGKGPDSKENYKLLKSIGEGTKEILPTFAEIEQDIIIPASTEDLMVFRAGRLHPDELKTDLKNSSVFHEVEKRFMHQCQDIEMKRPMLPLKPTHMGVAIAAGAVGGNLGSHIVSGLTKQRNENSNVYDDDGNLSGQRTTYYFKSVVRVFTPDNVYDLE
ncbi:DUF6094 domain-containing protein [Paenibacillus thiaminolyticus]|uniref:Class I SAM-dependent methyltransferase n=1 Tax=Paenibacillus thiaminolyticus TaxID=49283 RepID=A0A3A3GYR8_PANTH|nr:DUF6094 domain-containing protein [Paenibacillus thiaminolyticus]RJG21367.1 class I SAM-dependent methyltransferase [Paenibacillus thiaminolyticus]